MPLYPWPDFLAYQYQNILYFSAGYATHFRTKWQGSSNKNNLCMMRSKPQQDIWLLKERYLHSLKWPSVSFKTNLWIFIGIWVLKISGVHLAVFSQALKPGKWLIPIPLGTDLNCGKYLWAQQLTFWKYHSLWKVWSKTHAALFKEQWSLQLPALLSNKREWKSPILLWVVSFLARERGNTIYKIVQAIIRWLQYCYSLNPITQEPRSTNWY